MICISSKKKTKKWLREKLENIFISSKWKLFDEDILFAQTGKIFNDFYYFYEWKNIRIKTRRC